MCTFPGVITFLACRLWGVPLEGDTEVSEGENLPVLPFGVAFLLADVSRDEPDLGDGLLGVACLGDALPEVAGLRVLGDGVLVTAADAEDFFLASCGEAVAEIKARPRRGDGAGD